MESVGEQNGFIWSSARNQSDLKVFTGSLQSFFYKCWYFKSFPECNSHKMKHVEWKQDIVVVRS